MKFLARKNWLGTPLRTTSKSPESDWELTASLFFSFKPLITLSPRNQRIAFACLIAVMVLASRLPFLGAGYGVNVDAWRVARAARNIALSGHYEASRLPGYPIQEIVSSWLWRGGPWALNGASAVLSVAALAGFAWSADESRNSRQRSRQVLRYIFCPPSELLMPAYTGSTLRVLAPAICAQFMMRDSGAAAAPKRKTQIRGSLGIGGMLPPVCRPEHNSVACSRPDN